MANNGLQIEDILARDEEILWRGKPKKSAYFTHVILKHLWLIILCIGGGILCLLPLILGLIELRGSLIELAMSSVFFITALIQILHIIKECIGYKNIEYALTNNRILFKSGIIGMDYHGLQYSEIGSVNLDVGIVDKIFNVGDIKIRYANTYTILYDLTDCYKVYKIVQKTILDIQTDIEYPNALRPDENPGFNTKYKNGDEK